MRENSRQPSAILGLRYNDRPGLLAPGIDVDRRYVHGDQDGWLRGTADPFPASRSRYASPPRGWNR